MKPRRLLHTTAMRLALRYAVFYAVLIALGLGVLYWATSRYVDAQLAAGLEQEVHNLATLDRQQGRQQLKALLKSESVITGENQRYYLIEETGSDKRTGNLLGWPPALNADGRVHNIWLEDDLIPEYMEDQDGYWPMIGVVLDDGARLLVAREVHQAEDLQEFILATMAIIITVSVGLALIMGWRLGRSLLDRIELINETAERVTAGDLSHRVPLSGQDDEFDELAGHLNSMLARIEVLLTGMRQVTDNVAHDLRRPLARMRNRIEVTLLETRKSEEYRRAMEETMSDAEELMRTFNALLEIAQTEAGSYRGEWREVDLSTLLRDLSELYEDQAAEHSRTFKVDIEHGLTVIGNRQLLAQAITNLLDNAFKFTENGGIIQLEAKRWEGKIQVCIGDNGPGIPVGQREKVIHRFVRLETARSTPGNGLGLSLVKAVADLHKARLQLEDNSPGLRVIIDFNS